MEISGNTALITGGAARVGRAITLGRWGSPQDAAEAVLYLVRADYVTGEVLFVDGGARWA